MSLLKFVIGGLVLFALLIPIFIQAFDVLKEEYKIYNNAKKQISGICARAPAIIEEDGLTDICQRAVAAGL